MISKTDTAVVLFSLLISIPLLVSVIPRVWVTDEVAYSLAAHSFAREGRIDIWNGFDEMPSWELALDGMRVIRGDDKISMYSVPAPLYKYISYPFFRILGLSGLFVVSILSFLLNTLLVYWISKMFMEEEYSAIAAVIYALATNSLSFTQYILPHLLSTALVCLSAFIVFKSISDKGNLIFPFTAGLAGGLAIGIRYTDAIAVIILGALMLVKTSKTKLVSFAIGVGPPLIAIGVENYLVYGNILETGYGNVWDYEIMLMECILAIILVAAFNWLLAKRGVSRKTRLGIAAAIGLLVILLSWDSTVMFVKTFYARVFDMDMEPVYIKVVHKRALVQGSPYLILSALSLFFAPKDNKRPLFTSVCALAVFNIIFYSAIIQHGGDEESYSMRYFMEAMPFLVILSVYSIRNILGSMRMNELATISIIFAIVAFAYLRDGNVIYSLDRMMRLIPTALSFMLLTAFTINLKTGRLRTLCILLLAASLAISFSFSYADWKVARGYSKTASNVESAIESNVADNSIVFINENVNTVSPILN